MKLYINKKKDFETFLELLKTNTGEDLYKKGIFVVPRKDDMDMSHKNPTTLRGLIIMMIEKDGNDCNLNFIDVSERENMESVFLGSEFNGDISKWDVSSVTNFEDMFVASEFNGDISKWDVSSGKNFKGMFSQSKFNGDISKWDVSSGENFVAMFQYSEFTGDISKWDVSNGKYFGQMFAHSKFNGNISKWDVSSGESFGFMFQDSKFNGDIHNWKIDSESDIMNMYSGCHMKLENMAKKPHIMTKYEFSEILESIDIRLRDAKMFNFDYRIKNNRGYIRIFSKTPINSIIDMRITERYNIISEDFKCLDRVMKRLTESPLKIEMFNTQNFLMASADLM